MIKTSDLVGYLNNPEEYKDREEEMKLALVYRLKELDALRAGIESLYTLKIAGEMFENSD